MRRMTMLFCLLFTTLLLAAGTACDQETRVESRSERIEESPPRTVSPGEPIVE